MVQKTCETHLVLGHTFSMGAIFSQASKNELLVRKFKNLTLLMYKAQIHGKYINRYICGIKISWGQSGKKCLKMLLIEVINLKKVKKCCFSLPFEIRSTFYMQCSELTLTMELNAFGK